MFNLNDNTEEANADFIARVYKTGIGRLAYNHVYIKHCRDVKSEFMTRGLYSEADCFIMDDFIKWHKVHYAPNLDPELAREAAYCSAMEYAIRNNSHSVAHKLAVSNLIIRAGVNLDAEGRPYGLTLSTLAVSIINAIYGVDKDSYMRHALAMRTDNLENEDTSGTDADYVIKRSVQLAKLLVPTHKSQKLFPYAPIHYKYHDQSVINMQWELEWLGRNNHTRSSELG